MLAIAVPSGREFCVDYACRCRVMYDVAVHQSVRCMLFIPFSRDKPKGASSRSVDTACASIINKFTTHQAF